MNAKIGMAIFLIAMIMGMALAVHFAGAEQATAEKGHVLVYVYDRAGDPIANATVKILNNNSQVLAYGTTDKNGFIDMNISGAANFTGVVKVEAKGYKNATQNITYSTTDTSGYIYIFHMEKSDAGYIAKAKAVYEAHKMAVIVGGGIIILLVLLMVLGGKKKIRW